MRQRPAAAPAAYSGPSGQRLHARQYCWWITFAHPYQETVERLQLKTPNDFTRGTFLELIKSVYAAAGLNLMEVAVFLEPHQRTDDAGNRLLHLNCLTKCAGQHSWQALAQALRQAGVAVDFAANIKTWFDGVAYGFVASDHKPECDLDSEPLQWAAHGTPTPFQEVLPPRWRGGRRQSKLTPLQMYDLFLAKGITTGTSAWALATEMSASGERGLLAALLAERDLEGFIGRVVQASGSRDRARRHALGHGGLLEEAACTICVCTPTGTWKRLAVETLDRNGVREEFCRTIYKVITEGRKKKNNLFLIGPTNAAKSFVVKPLTKIFRAYTMPDGGSYQLEDLLDAELMFLNDFEWDPKRMAWSYFKDFLEGSRVQVARPKNRGGNQAFDRVIPVVGTCASPIQYVVRDGRRVVVHEGETMQMESRVTYVRLPVGLAAGAVVECPPCPCCAAELYISGKPTAV